MNDKEKKAVEIIKKEITRPYKTPLEVYITDIKMLLHLMEKQEKVIDKMAKKLEEITINDDDANLLPFRDYNVNIEEIKQYFYRKAEEV